MDNGWGLLYSLKAKVNAELLNYIISFSSGNNGSWADTMARPLHPVSMFPYGKSGKSTKVYVRVCP